MTRLTILALLCLAGCAGREAGASVEARSDEAGVLFVVGDRWRPCAPVTVRLPAPWTTSRVTVNEDGRFTVTYPVPAVKPYAGTVRVHQRSCGGEPATSAETSIVVGDGRLR